ncbi:hypothetical protein NLI96_g11908 [Meripilus lineatus]|uniref:Uncharacterized protein n=1 Tax=Meripilus lineatus TaxID=2056292 RepID=A0AAD5UR31_9APHY|nr:hypothetical protein NLI96_g11908 [Physisporinus lineatus]
MSKKRTRSFGSVRTLAPSHDESDDEHVNKRRTYNLRQRKNSNDRNPGKKAGLEKRTMADIRSTAAKKKAAKQAELVKKLSEKEQCQQQQRESGKKISALLKKHTTQEQEDYSRMKGGIPPPDGEEDFTPRPPAGSHPSPRIVEGKGAEESKIVGGAMDVDEEGSAPKGER